MLQLELAGQRYDLAPGEMAIGSDPNCAIRLEGQFVLPRHLLVVVTKGAVSVRRAVPDAEIFINGVRLGPDPSPVLHGDKILLGQHELLVADAQRAGGTMMLDAAAVLAAAGGAAPDSGTGPTLNGRLVCLTDGREYTIGEATLVFGREAGSGVVVPSSEVSRRHAEIRATPHGYVLTDFSANGTRVNGHRINGSKVLARADVITVGPEDFRFYADMAPPSAPPMPPPPPERAAAGAEERLADTLSGLPPGAQVPPAAVPPRMSPPAPAPAPTPAPAPAPPAPVAPVPAAPAEKVVLASLLVRSGALKGDRLQIRTPIVNIGRAEYNDIVLADPSVSTSHAKLQRRGAVWVLVDLESTNGTFVDGDRVQGEVSLSPGSTIKFGEVQVMFDSRDSGEEERGGTQVIRGADLVAAAAAAAGKPAAPPPAPSPPSTPTKPTAPPPKAAAPAPRKTAPAPAPAPAKGGLPIVPIVVGLLVLGAIAFFLLSRK